MRVRRGSSARSSWPSSAWRFRWCGTSARCRRRLRPPFTLTLGAPPGTELGSGDDPLDAAISPDQRQIVFVATRAGTTIAVAPCVRLDSRRALAGTEGARLPAWSPAGDAVLVFRRHATAVDHARRRHTSATSPTPRSPAGATWLPDGSILFAPQTTGAIRRLRDGRDHRRDDASSRRSRSRVSRRARASGTISSTPPSARTAAGPCASFTMARNAT